MKKFEKYINDICVGNCEFIKEKKILKEGRCYATTCSECQALFKEWLMEEYVASVESEIDWTKVPINTPVLVRDDDDEDWELRYFVVQMPCATEDYSFCVFGNEESSQTARFITQYKQCKLADGIDATPFLKEV